MSVIADLQVTADAFELGRILDLEAGEQISLESMIPMGGAAVPFFWVHEEMRSEFEENVRDHPSVDRIELMESHEDRTLYAIRWRVDRDLFFAGIIEERAQVMSARGTGETWQFELRFPSHESLSDFKAYCDDAHLDLTVLQVYNPTKPEVGPWFGLTRAQRETLVRAVERGYYSIPRGASTQDLARELGISDQAVTERLRRAIETLVQNTLMSDPLEEPEHDREQS